MRQSTGNSRMKETIQNMPKSFPVGGERMSMVMEVDKAWGKYHTKGQLEGTYSSALPLEKLTINSIRRTSNSPLQCSSFWFTLRENGTAAMNYTSTPLQSTYQMNWKKYVDYSNARLYL
jgi:hypothetical protein